MDSIKITKCYSARKAMQFIPQITNEPAMRRFIDEDMKGKNILNAKILKRSKQKRYYIKGENLIALLQLVPA